MGSILPEVNAYLINPQTPLQTTKQRCTEPKLYNNHKSSIISIWCLQSISKREWLEFGADPPQDGRHMGNLMMFLSDFFHTNIWYTCNDIRTYKSPSNFSIMSQLTKTNAELAALVSSTTTKTVISGQENQTNTRCINKKLHREKGHGFKKNFSWTENCILPNSNLR